jgi:DNA mismatch endonuclease (patch repair protein)
MADRLSPEARSRNMARITGKNTRPEMTVRKLLHEMGYRYRLHLKGVPGKADIALPHRHKAILVHGCFWHRHPGCRYAYTPKSRVEFWERKFASNVERDARTLQELTDQGWNALVVWECETKLVEPLRGRLSEFLGPAKAAA